MKTVVLIALVVAPLISGCLYQHMGTRFDPAVINDMKPGVTTEQDAIAKLGAPSARGTQADGSQLLQWQYVYGTPIGGGGAHAALLFGADGKLARVVHVSQQ